MLFKKLSYNIRSAYKKLPLHNKVFDIFKYNISTDKMILALITIIISTYLIGSIYKSLNNINKYKILNQEKKYLEELVEENKELRGTLKYYGSSFYKKLYARESLNLVQPNEELFEIIRKENIDYKNLDKKKIDPIYIDNNKELWLKLFF